MHEIKPGRKPGYLLTRSFSCFCSYCIHNDFEHCINKSITGGNFIERTLTSNSTDSTNAKLSHRSEDEIDEDSETDEMLYMIDNEKQITVEKQELKFTDLKVGSFIVVPVEGCHNKYYYYQAQITELEEDETIHIDYLKTVFDQPRVLLKCTSADEKNYVILLEDIIMKLPEPKVDHRGGRYTFNEKINLNK